MNVKVLVIIWLITMLIDVLLPFAIAPSYKKYNHKEHVLSVLGCRQSPVKRIYNGWCIISGCVFYVVGYVIYVQYPGVLAILIWVLLGLYGVGCEIISGIFPLEEKKETMTFSAKVHGVGSAIGFTLIIFAPLFFSILQFQNGSHIMGLISAIGFLCTLICFICFILCEKETFKHTVLRFGGLWQKLTMVVCYVPFILYCIYYLQG